jgi:hypothetical protein
MKKVLGVLLMLFTTLSVISCSNNYQIPDIIGMNIDDAKLLIAGEVKTNVYFESTNQFLPDTVMGFVDDYEVSDMINQNKVLNIKVAKAPEGSFSHSSIIEYVYNLGFVTGPDSNNFDILRASGAGSTDLGIPVSINDKMIYLYGDTFSGTSDMSGIWKSNFIAISEDNKLNDGISFSRLVTTSIDFIRPFAEGLHNKSVIDEDSDNPNREVTKIPTGGIQIGDNVYLFYMSIRYWGTHGDWAVSYSQVVKTDTNFTDFTEVDGLRWSEEDARNFAQMYPFEDPNEPNYVYFVSIPGGRNGGVALSRVLKTNFEDIESYEYYLGSDTWVSGSNGLSQFKSNPYLIIPAPCGELSIMFNNYLDKWMIVYFRNSEIVFQTADDLTGDWSSLETIVTSSDYSGLYGGFIHPNLVEYDGQKFYFQLSRWLPIYQTQLIEVVLK